MTLSGGNRAVLVLAILGVVVGVMVGRREAPSSDRRPTLRARELRLTDPASSATILLGLSAEESPALWLGRGPEGGSAQLGVHGNGFPFALVSDAAIRNFGLLRVDGRNASPILVYRTDDVVRLVFGLSMTEAGQPPFLVGYTADGRKDEIVGRYCDDPSRACIQ